MSDDSVSPAGEIGSELSKLKVSGEPLVSGPWNNFCLRKPEGFHLPKVSGEKAVQTTLLGSLLPSVPSKGKQSFNSC